MEREARPHTLKKWRERKGKTTTYQTIEHRIFGEYANLRMRRMHEVSCNWSAQTLCPWNRGKIQMTVAVNLREKLER